MPKPRRRHSCILLSKCLVMFGGFDSSFFNDLHILDLDQGKRGFSQMHIEDSKKENEFFQMINSKEGHDVVFRLISNDENLNKILGL